MDGWDVETHLDSSLYSQYDESDDYVAYAPFKEVASYTTSKTRNVSDLAIIFSSNQYSSFGSQW